MEEVRNFLATVPRLETHPSVPAQFFSENHVVFEGLPRRHGSEEGRMVLITAPGTGAARFYEFAIEDIDRFERLKTVVSQSGQALPIVRIWVRKGARAVRFAPFVVDDEALREG